MGALIKTRDWSNTPLGPLETWPGSLKTTLALTLGAPVPMALLWGQGGILLYNDAYAALAGARHPDLLGREVRDAWPEIADFDAHVMRVVLAGGTLAYHDRELVLDLNGRPERLFLDLSYSPVMDESGQPAGVLALVIDTTERVLARRRDVAERERLARMFEQAPGFMAMLEGPEHRIALANSAYLKLVGDRDVLGRTVAEALPDAVKQGYLDLLDRVFASGEAYAASGAKYATQVEAGGRSDERHMDFVFQPVRDTKGRVTGIFVQGTDVTEWKRAEADLRKSVEQYSQAYTAADRRAAEMRAVLESIPDAVYIGSTEGITLANKPALDQLGFTSREELNRHIGTLAEEIQTRDAATGVQIPVERQAFTRALGGEHVVQDVLVRHRLTGEDRIVRCAAAPVVIDGGVIAAVAVNTDVTETRWVEAALREGEARQRFRVELGDALRPLASPAEIQAAATRLLASHLGASRVHYVEMEPDGEHAVVPEDHAPAVPNRAGRYRLADFAALISECRAGHNFISTDLAADPRPSEAEKAMYAFLPVAAIVVVPLVKEGRLVALLAVHREAPHAWNTAEVALVEEVAERTWAAIERARAETGLRASEERLRLIVEGARDYAIFTTDPEGRIDAWLPGAAAVFGWSAEEAVGQSDAVTFTPEDRDKGALEGERETANREGTAQNVRWHQRKDGTQVFIEGSVAALRGPDGQIRGFLKIGQDVTARKAAEERQSLLMREVDHRAKNALSVVSAALRLTRAPDLPSYVKAIQGRISTLARAQTLLADDRWAGADLRTLLRGELAAFIDVGATGGPRVEASGPPVKLPAGAAQPLAMSIHELATNAIKYGALSTSTGVIAIRWEKAGSPSEMVRLRWVESGGPLLNGVPERRGFGTRVLDRTVRGQLGGTVSLAWNSSGLVCEIEVPLRPRSQTVSSAMARWAD